MKFRQISGSESVGEMPLLSAGKKDEEGDVVIVKDARDNLKDTALHGRGVTLIETINDNKTSRGRCIEISPFKWLTKRLDNEINDLGFKGSSEDERVFLNGIDNLLPRLGDVDRDLVGNCSDEGFGGTACGIGTRKEEAGQQQLL